VLGNAQILGERQSQEDYFATFRVGAATIAVVADGMGGHVAGAIASELAVKTFRAYLEQHADELQRHTPAVLGQAVAAANARIRAHIEANPEDEGMGTTLVAVALIGNRLFHVSVGDSLLYQLRQHTLERINANHAYAELLKHAVASGELTAEEAANDPDRHGLLSAIQGREIEMVDLPEEPIRVQPGDQYILATDGIHSIDEAQIAALVGTAPNALRAAESLTEAVEAARTTRQDNTTVITLFVPEERVTQPIARGGQEASGSTRAPS
jgi:PPM family protein phosphatase